MKINFRLLKLSIVEHATFKDASMLEATLKHFHGALAAYEKLANKVHSDMLLVSMHDGHYIIDRGGVQVDAYSYKLLDNGDIKLSNEDGVEVARLKGKDADSFYNIVADV